MSKEDKDFLIFRVIIHSNEVKKSVFKNNTSSLMQTNIKEWMSLKEFEL